MGLKCQTPLRLKAWVEEMEGFFLDWIREPENNIQLGPKPKAKLKVCPKAENLSRQAFNTQAS